MSSVCSGCVENAFSLPASAVTVCNMCEGLIWLSTRQPLKNSLRRRRRFTRTRLALDHSGQTECNGNQCSTALLSAMTAKAPNLVINGTGSSNVRWRIDEGGDLLDREHSGEPLTTNFKILGFNVVCLQWLCGECIQAASVCIYMCEGLIWLSTRQPLKNFLRRRRRFTRTRPALEYSGQTECNRNQCSTAQLLCEG